MQARRRLTREFKLEAVGLANTRGVTLKQVGKEPGINPHLQGNRPKQLHAEGEQSAFPGHEKPRDEEMARTLAGSPGLTGEPMRARLKENLKRIREQNAR